MEACRGSRLAGCLKWADEHAERHLHMQPRSWNRSERQGQGLTTNGARRASETALSSRHSRQSSADWPQPAHWKVHGTCRGRQVLVTLMPFILPAPSVGKYKETFARGAHTAFSAAAESRVLKWPFQHSGLPGRILI